MQWTSRFFEVVIVASCNEYLSLNKKKKKTSTNSLKVVVAVMCDHHFCIA